MKLNSILCPSTPWIHRAESLSAAALSVKSCVVVHDHDEGFLKKPPSTLSHVDVKLQIVLRFCKWM